MSRLFREALRKALEGPPEERPSLTLNPLITTALKSLVDGPLWELMGLDYVETDPRDRQEHPFVGLSDICNWLNSESLPIEDQVGYVLMCRGYSESEATAIVVQLYHDKLCLVQ